MSTDIYTTQRKLNEILGIGGIEPSITNDYLNEAHEHPVSWPGGRMDWTGLKHTPETVQRMKDRPDLKNNNYHTGHKHTGDMLRFGANKGKKRSAETLKKISESLKKTLGGKTYQGTPCRKAGHTERYVISGLCVACKTVYDKERNKLKIAV